MRGMSTLATATTTTTTRVTRIMSLACVETQGINIEKNNGNHKKMSLNMSNEIVEYNQNYDLVSNILTHKFDFTINELYDAYIECKKGKKSINALKFELNLEENLFNILSELNNETYVISRAICFIVTKPKVREVWASDFRDRVVHHLITRKIELYYENEFFNNSFLSSSYANRKGKGTHRAVNELKIKILEKKYYLKLDIKSFFNSIDRNILYDILVSDFKDIQFDKKSKIFLLFKTIINHNYTLNYINQSPNLFYKIPFYKSLFSAEKNKKGLPIGNLTSQFLSNVYLNKLDYFIQKELDFKDYIRYVDDFIILSNDKEELQLVISKIEVFLKDILKLELAPNKII
jgi:RNA-directed DNA polymerase